LAGRDDWGRSGKVKTGNLGIYDNAGKNEGVAIIGMPLGIQLKMLEG
jgi:hypothetical protein